MSEVDAITKSDLGHVTLLRWMRIGRVLSNPTQARDFELNTAPNRDMQTICEEAQQEPTE